jgi:hypothetical protein
VLRGDAPAAITPLGRAACATLAFRAGGQLRVAVIVKATFIFVQDRPMLLVDPDPILRADEHHNGSPSSSLVAADDRVPYRPRADVLLRGHARAPWGLPTPAMAVRLMVARDRDLLLDKRLAVRGAPDPSGRGREPLSFEAMTLAYELAAGGPGSPDNPVGIPEGPRQWPNILDPRQRERPAGFGPIAPRWPSRRRLLGAHEGAVTAAVPDLPADFAWAYFNAAPEDQRIDFLRGDEWVGFEGMNAQIPRVQSCLPGVRGAARVYGLAQELRAGKPIALSADTLSIDASHLRCWVVWRGSFPVAHEDDLHDCHIFAGVETAELPLPFPASYSAPPGGARDAVRPVQARPLIAKGAAVGAAAAPPRPTVETVAMPAYPASPLQPATPFESREPAPVIPTAEIPVDVVAMLRSAPATPFVPSPALPPREPLLHPLPAATPFEQHASAPLSSAPITPERVDRVPLSFPPPPPVAPPSVAPPSVAPASVAPASVAPASVAPASVAPASVAPASVAPASVASAAEPEAPRTLGAAFLAAVARCRTAPSPMAG